MCLLVCLFVCLLVRVIHEVLEAEATPKNPFLVSVFSSMLVCLFVCLSVCLIHDVLEAEAMPKNPFSSVCSQEEGSETHVSDLPFFAHCAEVLQETLVNSFLVSVTVLVNSTFVSGSELCSSFRHTC